MIIVKTGTVVYNKAAITPKDEPQTLPPEVEARLVSDGFAEYVDKPARETGGKGVATPPAENKAQGEGDNPPDKEPSPESDKPALDDPQYSVDMKAAELREIMEDCQLPYKVGMSKGDMVAALDAYFEDEAEDTDEPPDLGAEDPIV